MNANRSLRCYPGCFPLLQLIGNLSGLRPVVRVVAMLKDQFFVEIDVELAVFGGHQVAIANSVAILL